LMTCIHMHMCVGLSVLSDTLGFMLSLGLEQELERKLSSVHANSFDKPGRRTSSFL